MKRDGRLRRSVLGLRPRVESPKLRKFRREVRERDNYTCQYPGCDRHSKRIDVHHKAKRSQRPDLKFTVSNGICLCRQHHDWTDFNHDKAADIGLRDLTTYELARKSA